uniref:Conodipine 5 n=1 Tax=Conus geographus TaxID=6491 RepID=W4VS60_CONGE
MKMLAPVLWAMVALGVTLLMDVDSASEQSCTTYSNGCSTPLPLPCREYFRPACDKHDSCYYCGKTLGISRTKCDDAFYTDMLALCAKLPLYGYFVCTSRRKRQVASARATPIARSTPWKKALHQKSFLNREARLLIPMRFITCRDWASNYHEAVSLFGGSHYSGTVHETGCEGLSPCLPDH